MAGTVRPAARNDESPIQRIAHRAWHAARAPIVGEATVTEIFDEYDDPDSIRVRIDHADAILLVATGTDGVLGFGLAGPDEDTPAT